MKQRISGGRPYILIFAPGTCLSSHRTGVQRVAVEASLALAKIADVDFVKWDGIDCQMRYFNADDFQKFFCSADLPTGVRIHPLAERRRYRFGDTLPTDDRDQWLFMPEIFYHFPAGEKIYACVLAQAREYRIQTATIFYDLIPISNADYADALKSLHERYVHQLLDVDLIMPISSHSSIELARYFSDAFDVDDLWRRSVRQDIVPVSLATAKLTVDERGFLKPEITNRRPDFRNRRTILMLGTVEPRKRQVETLEEILRRDLLERFNLNVVVAGALHPKVARRFTDLINSNSRVHHLGHATDDKVADVLSTSRFSVFASNDEGFGLPICESLASGIPCVTANFGPMAEIAEGGGCILVDVNDLQALGDTIQAAAADDTLLERLSTEINGRQFRTWQNYATDIINAMQAWRRHTDISPALTIGINALAVNGGTVKANVLGVEWTLTTCDVGDEFSVSQASNELQCVDRAGVIFKSIKVGRSPEVSANLSAVLKADVAAFSSRMDFEVIVTEAGKASVATVLPTRCAIGGTPHIQQLLHDEIISLSDDVSRRRIIARREAALAKRARDFMHRPLDGPDLHIVISTYNRAPFVVENTRWTLAQIAPYGRRVSLTVVDNASTDNSVELLQDFKSNPQFELKINSSNVGMLGNLQVCSALQRARHTWVIGDDDFITPGTVELILKCIENHPSIPFIFLNFGVYHRVELGADDHAERLIRDPIKLTQLPTSTARMPVWKMAAQHDNLFTAIYPIVFRSDILAACFNYPFTGVPFSSLVESVPTTKIILETYAECECQWLQEIGVVGNAHNSWARFRVPWHGILMPLVFELGREAGIDPKALQQWSKIHRDLYGEARSLFPSQELSAIFGEAEMDCSFRIFRGRLDTPETPVT